MTIANQANRTSAVGSGAIGQEVPFLFPITATSDLLVKKRITATGVETTLDETTNYTVEIDVDHEGGTLTTVTAIELTEQIHIIRNTPKTQGLDLEIGGSFSAPNVESALDKNTKLIIENKDAIGKAITFPPTDASGLTTELPSSIDRASKNLTFDASGNVAASASVEEGSVSFTTFGTNMAEATNALAGKAVINLDHALDIRDYGTVDPTGTADSTAVIQATIDAATAYQTVVLPPGTYLFSQLKFYNPIVFTGLGSVAARWNSEIAGVTLLHDESTDPAIIIGGTDDSVITSGGFNIAEGITLANFFLYPAGATANVGILLDGSTTISATRGNTKNIRFENVTVRTFGSNNIKFLGNVFDVRFKGGGSRANATNGVVAEAAASEGSNNPGQLHFYDFYSQAQTGDWNFKGRGIHLYGGGCAYGNGMYALSHCKVFGTHFEAVDADPASIGLQIVGQYGNFQPGVIGSYDTAIKIGDGTATAARSYFINTTITGATLGVEITDGGSRYGSGIIYFAADVTTDIQDDRAGTDGVYNELHLLYDRRTIKNIKTLANEATPTVGDSMASGGIFITGGTTPITDLDDGYPGQIAPIISAHTVPIINGTNIFLKDDRDWTMKSGDTLTLIQKADTFWYEVSRSHNTSNSLANVVCNENQVVCNNNQVVMN